MNHLNKSIDTSREITPANSVLIAKHNHPKYQEIQAFIQKEYLKYFNAQISVDMPILVAYYESGILVGAMGLRPAVNNILFLEQYLEKPIEACVANLSGIPVKRNTILEVGNLALKDKQVASFVIPTFMSVVYEMKYTWCALSATNEIARLFENLGLKSSVLAMCDPTKIVQDDNDWGTYYSYEPKVIVGNLDDVKHRMKFCETLLFNNHQTNIAR